MPIVNFQFENRYVWAQYTNVKLKTRTKFNIIITKANLTVIGSKAINSFVYITM